MKIDEIATKYPVLKKAVKRIKEVDKIDELFPPQEEAIKTGYLEGKNLVLAIATSCGKTMCAELAMLKTILETGRKAIYLVPLKALAMEKYREFKEKYESLGIKVAVSIGGYDKTDSWLSDFDIIITSNEKCDSLLRHNSPCFREVGIVIADEIHMIDDVGRGPTLEIALTKLRELNKTQILALSATIQNSSEIARWLDAELVKSDFRPTKLYEGICCGGKVKFPSNPKNNFTLGDGFEDSVLLGEYIYKRGKQSLVFVSTKKGTGAEAKRVANKIKEYLKPEERKRLSELALKIEKALDHPTVQCKKLADVVRDGVAFHNSGLAHKQKTLVEDAFRSGLLKSIAATSTLAFGINLPSDFCIMRDVKRYYSPRGYDFIPVLEYKQCAGRAGRIKYSTEGRAIIIAKNKSESKKLAERFILGEPEKITSKLGVEPVLRMHVLALIASGATTTRKELMEFFSRTFYAHQYQDLQGLEKILNRVLELLENFRFITAGEKSEEKGREEEWNGKEADEGEPVRKEEVPQGGAALEFKPASSLLDREGEDLKPTRIGKRVSELYIDPLTADHLIKSLKKAGKPGQGLSHLGLLHAISNTIEMKPLLNLRKKDFENMEETLAQAEPELLDKPPSPWDLEYDDFLRSIKTAMMLRAWTRESGEDILLEAFNITPGELRARLDIADWLLYSIQELSLLLGHMNLLRDIRKARLRVRYGVRKELLPLVRLKKIGRRRARMLFNSGVKGLRELREIPLESLERLIGAKTARDIKDQLGENVQD